MSQSARLRAAPLTALVVASMIGAGVFTTSGFVLADLGSPFRVVLVWALGGVMALLGAVSYGLIARFVMESGGEYVYLARNVHPLAGFIAGWVSMLAGFSGAIAYAASAFGTYLFGAPAGAALENATAIVLIAIAGVLHGGVPRFGLTTQTWSVALKLVVLIAFVGAGFWLRAAAGAATFSGPAAPPAWSFPLIASSLVWVFLSYSGFNAAVYVAEEVAEPARLVPRTMIVGTIIVTVLYLALNTLFVYGAPYAVVAGAPNVAYVVAGYLGGAWFAESVRVLVLLGLFTSVLSMMMAGPRVYMKMAADGLLPGALGSAGALPRAVLLQAILASLFVLVSELRELLAYLGFTLSLSSAAAIASVFLDYRRAPDPARPLWHWLVPLAYVVITLVLAAVAASRTPAEFGAAILTLVLGCAGYLVARRAGRRVGR